MWFRKLVVVASFLLAGCTTINMSQPPPTDWVMPTTFVTSTSMLGVSEACDKYAEFGEIVLACYEWDFDKGKAEIYVPSTDYLPIGRYSVSYQGGFKFILISSQLDSMHYRFEDCEETLLSHELCHALGYDHHGDATLANDWERFKRESNHRR